MKKTVKKSLAPFESKEVPEIPVLEINAPLAVENTPVIPVIDTVMIHAKKKWLVGLSFFILFLCIVSGIGYGYMENSTIAPVQTSAPPSRPILPSPPPVIAVKMSVWNGSGVAGLAGKVGDAMKQAGYEVGEVKNAPETQKGTTLYLHSVVRSKEEEITKELEKNNITVSKVEELGSEEYNVRIVIGR